MFYVISLENRYMYHYYTIDTVEEVMKIIDNCIADPRGDCDVMDSFGFIFTEEATHNKPITIVITGSFTEEMTYAIRRKLNPEI
jgi:hypothetical protein